jgi:hypothetical protein
MEHSRYIQFVNRCSIGSTEITEFKITYRYVIEIACYTNIGFLESIGFVGTEFRNCVCTVMVKMAAHHILCGYVNTVTRGNYPRTERITHEVF